MKIFVARKEVFGAAVHNRLTNKIEFITEKELEKFLSGDAIDLGADNISLKNTDYIQSECIPNNFFSAPNAVYLELTKKCNLRCKHCFNSSGTESANEWSQNRLLALIDEMAEMGVFGVRFTGGEVLASNLWEKAILYASEKGIYSSIGTNGTLVTEDVAEKLKLAGLKFAVISIDGCEKSHDHIRGRGNYDRALKGAKNLIDAGIKVRLNMTIMRSNYKDARDLIAAAEKLEADIVLRRYIPTGNSQNLDSEMLTPAEYQKFNEEISEIEKNINVHIFSHYKESPAEREKRVKTPFYNGKCQAGIVTCAITPSGDIFPCGVLVTVDSSLKVGNTHDKGLADVWRNSKVMSAHRENIKLLFERCDNCKRTSSCVGSCTALLYKSKGNDPYCEENL